MKRSPARIVFPHGTGDAIAHVRECLPLGVGAAIPFCECDVVRTLYNRRGKYSVVVIDEGATCIKKQKPVCWR